MAREVRAVRGTRIRGDPVTERGQLDAPEAKGSGELLEAEVSRLRGLKITPGRALPSML